MNTTKIVPASIVSMAVLAVATWKTVKTTTADARGAHLSALCAKLNTDLKGTDNMHEYDAFLRKQFGDLPIILVKHDEGVYGFPAYLLVSLGKRPKDRGETAKDLSNYLYRLGFKFETRPEYQGKGKNTTVRFFITWHQLKPLIPNIIKAVDPESIYLKKDRIPDYFLPFSFRSLIVQDTSRSVYANS